MPKLQKRHSGSMGIFSKSRKPVEPSHQLQQTTQAPETRIAPTADVTNSSTNSFGNSIPSSSNLSSAPTRAADHEPPGTTVVTTTTTTTTTTTVRPDGSTAVQTSQYNPTNDPPPNTNTVQRPDATTVQAPASNISSSPISSATSSATLNGSKMPSVTGIPSPIPEAPAPLVRQHTGGGREIPPRSSSRHHSRRGSAASNSESTQPLDIPRPQQTYSSGNTYGMPNRQSQDSELNQNASRPTSGYHHLNPSEPQELSTSPPTHQYQEQRQSGRPVAGIASATGTAVNPVQDTPSRLSQDTPSARTTARRDSYSETTAWPLASPLSSHPPTQAQPSPAPVQANKSVNTDKTKRKPLGFTSTLKGLHGAGDALRGAINLQAAKATNDTVEIERQRRIKEEGLRDLRESGMAERLARDSEQGGYMDRLAHGRPAETPGVNGSAVPREHTRRRSAGPDNGVYGSAGPQGLTRVGEVEERLVV